MTQQKNTTAYLLLILAPLIWSGNYLAGRALHTQIPPMALTFYRWLLVTIVLFPCVFIYSSKYWLDIKKHSLKIIILSLTGVVLNPALVYLGLYYSTALNAGLFSSISPVLVILLAYFILNESLTTKRIYGIVFSLLGVILIVTHGDPKIILTLSFNIGDCYLILSAVVWAFYSVLLKKYNISLPPVLFLFVLASVGTIILLPCFLLEQHLGFRVHYNWLTLGGVSYAAIFSSVAGYACWNHGVLRVGACTAGYFMNLTALFSALLGIVFLHETLFWFHIFGFSLISLGIYLALQNNKIIMSVTGPN